MTRSWSFPVAFVVLPHAILFIRKARDASLQLSDAELAGLEGAATAFAEARHGASLDKLVAWPTDLMFPVIDLARIMCLDAAAAAFFASRMCCAVAQREGFLESTATLSDRTADPVLGISRQMP
jgi:hypothetical protein